MLDATSNTPGGNVPLAELRLLAEHAARAGGAVARAAFGRAQTVRLKADRSEVTDVDLAAEHAVVEYLVAQRPFDSFITEENVLAARAGGLLEAGAAARADERGVGAARVHWVIDPIDGTRNFIRGIPCFACSVAAMVDGWPVAGAIFDPMQNRLYSADARGAAEVDGTVLRLRADDSPEQRASGGRAKLLAAIPSMRHARSHPIVLRWINDLVIRNFGATTLHLTMIAAGQLDAALLATCKLWDIAAGWIIVTAAGGAMTTLEGGPIFPLELERYVDQELPSLAAHPAVHGRLLRHEAAKAGK